MKIGIDASILSTLHESGLRRYQRNVLMNLAKIDKVNQFYIFSPKKISIPNQNNFELILFPVWLPILKRQIIIPLMSRSIGIDVFHFPDVWGSIIPPCSKTIVTLQDLAPNLSYPSFIKSPKYYASMWVNRIIKKFTIKNASKIIVPSKAIHKEYVRAYGNDSRIVVIPNGISEDFKITNKNNIQKYILAFSDFSPRKNIERVLEAYKLYSDKYRDDIKLVIVASTTFPKTQILTKARELGIENKVKVMIGTSTNKLIRLYNQSECLIYPSLYEGFGLPIIEAMACGCPVVTSNYGAMKEVAGDAAILVNPYSSKSIYSGMTQILLNLRLRKELIRKGIKRASNFSWEIHAKEVLRLYNNLKGN